MLTLEYVDEVQLRNKLQRAARAISPECSVRLDAEKGTFAVETAIGHTLLTGRSDVEGASILSMTTGDLKYFLIELIGGGEKGQSSLADAWRELEETPGIEDLRMPSASNIIFINVRYGRSELETVCLTPEQLRLAVEYRLSNDDLVNERYPWVRPPAPVG